jgi:hypothetical protein
MKKTILVAASAAALAAAAPVLGCGDGPNGVNLVATPAVKAALVQAYAARTGVQAQLVPGRTYYGSHVGTWYAVASFQLASGPSLPVVFATDPRGRWRVSRLTHGGVCTDAVPIDLIHVWWLRHWGGRCFVEP